MYLILDNTKNLDEALMTPKLIAFFEDRQIPYQVISSCREITHAVRSNRKYTKHHKQRHRPKIQGIILSGGPLCLSNKVDLELFHHNLMALLLFPETPILGICFGFQVMALAYGGHLSCMGQEYTGDCLVQPQQTRHGLFRGLTEEFRVFASHNDHLTEAPPCFKVTAKSHPCPVGENAPQCPVIQAISNRRLRRWGVQFHPEGSPETGWKLLDNFIRICQNFDHSLAK